MSEPVKSFNPAGRPKGSTTTETLRTALKNYEIKTGLKFLEIYFEQAFRNPATTRDLASRLWPALKSIEGDLEVNQKVLNIIGMKPIEVDTIKEDQNIEPADNHSVE